MALKWIKQYSLVVNSISTNCIALIYFCEKMLQTRQLVALCCNKWTHNQVDAVNHVHCHYDLFLHLQHFPFHLICTKVIFSFSKSFNKYCSSPVQQNGQPVISVDIFLQVFDCLRFKITLFIKKQKTSQSSSLPASKHVTDILSIWFVCHHILDIYFRNFASSHLPPQTALRITHTIFKNKFMNFVVIISQDDSFVI